MDETSRCDAPVTVPGVFSNVERDTGHRCQRAAGHPGVHRWQQRWTGVPPAVVEAEIERDERIWERDPDEDEPPAPPR